MLGEPSDFKYVARAAAHGSRQEIACSAHRGGPVQFWAALEKEDKTFVQSVRRARRSGSCRQAQMLRETGVRLFSKGAHPAHRQRTRWETIDQAGTDFSVWHVSCSCPAAVVRPPAYTCLLLRPQRLGNDSSGSSDDDVKQLRLPASLCPRFLRGRFLFGPLLFRVLVAVKSVKAVAADVRQFVRQSQPLSVRGSYGGLVPFWSCRCFAYS